MPSNCGDFEDLLLTFVTNVGDFSPPKIRPPLLHKNNTEYVYTNIVGIVNYDGFH
jgi:hypothetical protein